MTSASSAACSACNTRRPGEYLCRRAQNSTTPAEGGTIMKLITAIVRPEKLDELILALIDHGVRGLTVTDVRGFGQQYGRLAGAATRVSGRPGEHMAVLLAKVRLDLVTLD